MTDGWPIPCATSPISRPTNSKSAIWAMNSACDPPPTTRNALRSERRNGFERGCRAEQRDNANQATV